MAAAHMKRVNVLGSTGSVGRATVELIRSRPDLFAAETLTCNRNAALLAEQAVACGARHAVVADVKAHEELRQVLAGTGITTGAGPEAVIAAAARPADWIMAAIVGVAGLAPILAAIEQGTQVAIANKEPLVAAGALVMEAARKYGATLLPVDSEHNAIFQVFDPAQQDSIERIILTASGGPFREWSRERMARVTPQEAMAHPNWSMGAKISVDSATMMNKALEVIEAHFLFGLPPEKIDVLLHPQSIVHSMVEYADGSVLAQMGAPDMRTPIANALAWPERMATTGQRLDFSKAMALDFRPADHGQFPALALAYDVLRVGPAACIAMNAANEVAVQAFLDGEIGFLDIVDMVSIFTKNAFSAPPPPTLDEILALDATIRSQMKSHIIKRRRSPAA